MLSNTATPKYYGMFREKVINGEIPICETIRLEMNRIENLIKNPGVYYDAEAVEHWILFCENELTLTNGDPFFMLDSFKLWGEEIYGWYYFVDKSIYVPPQGTNRIGHYENKRIRRRLTQKQYLIVGRGGSKSMYSATHQIYFLVVDPTTTHQIVTAPTMKQADEVMSPIRTAITRSPGPLFQFMTEGNVFSRRGATNKRPKLAATKKGIEAILTNSLLEVRPLSIDKLQGLRCKVSSIDEWLSGEIREDPVVALEQGASKEEGGDGANDWLIIATSSEGTIRNGVGDDIKLELMDILRGKYQAPHTSIWWYRLDDVKEVGMPAMWVKANPNLGITVTYETYQTEVERSEHVPSAKNDILAKRFNLPMEGYTYFFTYQETLPHFPRKEFWRMPCSLGADLSMGDDFCAFDFLFPLGGGAFGVKARSYITERTFLALSKAMRQEYEKFLNEGSLIIMPGTILNMMDVYDDLDREIIAREYEVRTFGYDPYNAKEFVERWCRENAPFGVEKVIQGSKTESVPLGELKILAEERMLIFDQEIMKFSLGNAVALVDTNGNRKLYKQRKEQKIDNVAAMMDAYIAYKRHTEFFE